MTYAEWLVLAVSMTSAVISVAGAFYARTQHAKTKDLLAMIIALTAKPPVVDKSTLDTWLTDNPDRPHRDDPPAGGARGGWH